MPNQLISIKLNEILDGQVHLNTDMSYDVYTEFG